MSISDKLTSIADNMQKVYDAGNLLKKTNEWDYLFYYGYRLDILPYLKYEDASNVTSMSNTFYYAFSKENSFKGLPKLDTGKVTTFERCFRNCSYLTEFPDFDFSSGINFSYAFMDCERLKTVPDLDLSSGTNFAYMFQNCDGLNYVGNLDTRNVAGFYGMFYNCAYLEEVKSINFTNATSLGSIFSNCVNLKRINFVGTIPVSLALSSKYITYETIMNAINALIDNSENTTTLTLTLGTTNLAKITDEEKAIATEKGWTLA